MEIHHRVTNQIAVVFFEIRLSMDEVDEFKEYLLPLIRNPDIRGVLINLGSVEFIDSSGFGTIISIYKRLKEQDKKLAFCQTNEEVQEIFTMLAIDKKVRLFSSEAEAMEYLRK